MKFRVLLSILACCALASPTFAQTRGVTATLNAANQCAKISTMGQATVGIQVTGTFSLTLQPEVAIQGQAAQNTQVTPSTSTTPQATITSAGIYFAAVAGADTFLVCVSSYSSGSATVYLNATTAIATNAPGGGGGGGVIGNKCKATGTTSVACGSSTGGSFSCSTSGGTCTVATTAVTSTSVILVTLVGVPPPGSGVTCATTITPTAYLLTGITPGTGFTISNATFTTNVACYQYAIF